jgi:hypothetical protein
VGAPILAPAKAVARTGDLLEVTTGRLARETLAPAAPIRGDPLQAERGGLPGGTIAAPPARAMRVPVAATVVVQHATATTAHRAHTSNEDPVAASGRRLARDARTRELGRTVTVGRNAEPHATIANRVPVLRVPVRGRVRTVGRLAIGRSVRPVSGLPGRHAT